MQALPQHRAGSRLPPKTEAEAIRLYLAGEKRDRIIETVNIAKSTLDDILKRNGVALRNKYAPIGPEKEAEVVRLYNEGAERKTITEQTGVNGASITNILKRHGIERNHVRQPKIVPNAKADEVCRLYLEGKSYTQIGVAMGITSGTVAGIIYRRKVKRDPAINAANLQRAARARAPKPQPAPKAKPPKFVAVASQDGERVILVPETEAGKYAERQPEPQPMTAGEDPLTKLRALHCRWPIGEPGRAGFRFCCAKRPGAGPYCAEHARIAYRPAGKNDKVALASIRKWA